MNNSKHKNLTNETNREIFGKLHYQNLTKMKWIISIPYNYLKN